MTIENPIAIAWIELKYCVKSRFTSKPKFILNDINGSIDFRTITAIMGPSGSGKTTLLECISGRRTKGIDCNTKIYVNKDIEIKCCLIVQEVKEHLLNGLTTLQSVIHSSKLKNWNKSFDHELNARNILMSLNITNTANTCVDECSGGEQKRIAIALELTAEDKPNLLCIDEPTSGLDSCAAEEVMLCLKNLTLNNGIAVVTSIHQPSDEIIKLLDKLYILSIGGQCVYEGHPNQITQQLESIGIILGKDEVPIEVIIKMSSRIESQETIEIIELVRSEIAKLLTRCSRDALFLKSSYKTSIGFSWRQVWYLTQRNFIHIISHRIWSEITHFIILILLALAFPYTFSKDISQPIGCIDPLNPPVCNKSAQELIDEDLIAQNSAFLFLTTNVLMILIAVPGSMIFATDITIFFKEHSNGWYSTGSFYFARVLAELPLVLAMSLFFSLIVYKVSNQIDEVFRLWSYMCIMAMNGLTAQGYGLTVGILADSSHNQACLISLAVLFCYIFCDPFISWGWNETLDWLRYISYCTQVEQLQYYVIYGFNRCPNELMARVLWYYNINDIDHFYLNIIILFFHLFFIRLTGLLVLLVKANEH